MVLILKSKNSIFNTIIIKSSSIIFYIQNFAQKIIYFTTLRKNCLFQKDGETSELVFHLIAASIFIGRCFYFFSKTIFAYIVSFKLITGMLLHRNDFVLMLNYRKRANIILRANKAQG